MLALERVPDQKRLEFAARNAHYSIMIIDIETTPNPATLKFNLGRVVMEKGTHDFANEAQAQSSPLAQALFAVAGVQGVFYGKSFISVTLADAAQWGEAKADVLDVMLEHYSANLPLFLPDHAPRAAAPHAPAAHEGGDHAEIVEQILDLLETRIKPAVANDGGNIEFVRYAENIVYLELQGACAGCPSSTATLKHGIESLLKYYIPEVQEVVAVNG
jgi:Fe-S cluster biogenesis protein NfuA